MSTTVSFGRRPATAVRPRAVAMLAAVLVAAVIGPAPASAATLTWGVSGTGGTGTWSTASIWNGSTWNNANNDDARFTGTPGTVTLTTTATANSLTFTNYTGLYTLALNSQTLAIGGGGLTMNANSGSATLSGRGTILLTSGQTWTNSSTTGVLTVSSTVNTNGFGLTIAGSGSTSISGTIGGSGGLTKTDAGTLTLSAPNTYTGTTTISGGVLRLNNANAVPGGIGSTGGTSILTMNGGVLGLGVGNFSRGLGTGVTQVNLTNGGGFAAYTADRTVNLGGASAAVTWGAGNFVASGSTFILGAASATNTVDFQNPIDFGSAGTDRTIQVLDGSASVDAILSGALSGAAGLVKSGAGTLTLSASNTYTGTTTISGGVLLLNNANAVPGGIGSTGGTSILTMNGGVLGLGAGNFSRGLGTGATQVDLTNGGGFAAYTADRTVNLGGASAAVTWGAGNFVASGSTFILGAASATNTVDFQNPIDFGSAGTDRTIQVLDGSASVDAILNGALSGAAGLVKSGAGTLALGGTNTYTGATSITAGTLRFAKTVSLYNAGTASWVESKINVKSGGTLAINVGGSALGEFGTTDVTNLLTGLAASTSASNGMNAGSSYGFDTTNADGGTFTIADVLADSTGGSGGARGVTKLGTNALVLTAANTYTGATSITAGTLLLSNTSAIASSGSLALSNGATLGLRSNTTGTFAMPTATVPVGATVTIDVNNNGSGSGNTLTTGTVTVTPPASNGTQQINVTGGNGYTLRIPTLNWMGPVGNPTTLTLNPTSASLVVDQFNYSFGSGAQSLILDGTSTGNAMNTIASPLWLRITKQGASTWDWNTVVASGSELGAVTVNGGVFVINGTVRTKTQAGQAGLRIGASGTVCFNNAGALDSQGNAEAALIFTANGATLDNTSGAAITASTFNPLQQWNGDWTFLGSNGAASNLNLGTGTVSMNATRTLTVSNAATTLTVNGVITGAGFGLNKAGPGTLALGGTNTYTGVTSITAGTLRFAKTVSLYNAGTANWVGSKINVKSGGTLAINVGGSALGEFGTTNVTNLLTGLATSTSAANGMNAGSSFGFDTTNADGGTFTIADVLANSTGGSGGARGVTKLGTNTLVLTATNTYSGATTISGGTLSIGAGATAGSIGNTSGVTVASGATLAFNRTDNYGGTFTPAISGAGGLLVQGGILTLGAANTYTGATTITGGTLQTGIANALSGSSAITIGGVTTQGFLEIDHDLTISSLTFTGSGGDVSASSTGTATFSSAAGTATINVLSGSNVFHASATLSSPTIVDVTNGAFFTFHNKLSGGGDLTKSGSGTMLITGDNDQLTGNLFVTGGRLNIGSGMTQLGTGTATVSGGATLDLNGHSFGNTINVISGTLLNQALTTATTTITGTTTVGGTAAGVFNVNAGGVATFASTLGADVATVDVNVNSGGQAVFSGAVQSPADVVVNTGGQATFANTVSAGFYTHVSSTVRFDSTGTQTVSGQIEGPGSVVKQGAGLLVLTGTNSTFTGGVTVTSGTIQAGNALALGTGPLALNAGGLDLNGQAVSVGALSGSAATSVYSGVAGPASLVTNVAGNSTFAGVITNGSGTVSLQKTGAGKLTLTDAQTYTGNTIITGGTLALGSGGSFANSLQVVVGDAGSSGAVLDLSAKSNFTIGAGQTLQGKGTLLLGESTSLTVAGLLSPGNSPGLLTYDGGLTTLSGTTLMEIWGTDRGANPGYDAIDVINSGTLALGGLLLLDFYQEFASDTSFQLIDATAGTLGGGYSSFTVTGSNSPYAGLTFQSLGGGVWETNTAANDQALRLTQTSSTLTLQVFAVPEPSTLALAGLGLAGLALRLRRRRA